MQREISKTPQAPDWGEFLRIKKYTSRGDIATDHEVIDLVERIK